MIVSRHQLAQHLTLGRAQTRSGPWPRGLATRRPSLSAARTQFFTVLSATRNRRASAAAVPSLCS